MSLCSEHGKELTLFCKETQCAKLICSKCLTKHHRKHDVIDADDEKGEQRKKLLTNLPSAVSKGSQIIDSPCLGFNGGFQDSQNVFFCIIYLFFLQNFGKNAGLHLEENHSERIQTERHIQKFQSVANVYIS